MATRHKRIALAVGLLTAFLGLGMPTALQAAEAAKEQEATAGEARLVSWTDYAGDLWRRPAVTGDWGGTRQTLMDQGVRFDLSLIQTIQGNWAGGDRGQEPVPDECALRDPARHR